MFGGGNKISSLDPDFWPFSRPSLYQKALAPVWPITMIGVDSALEHKI
jgi:hypothetical protein